MPASLRRAISLLPLSLVRKLRRFDLEWLPREGFEKREQVRFFFLCQTKWLHERTQVWVGPATSIQEVDDFFQTQEDPIVHIGCGFEDAAQGGCLERAFIAFSASDVIATEVCFQRAYLEAPRL